MSSKPSQNPEVRRAPGWLAAALVVIAVTIAAAATREGLNAPAPESSPLASPAANHPAEQPGLATGPDGRIWLSWLETDANEATHLRVADFDPANRRWGAVHTVVTRKDWTAGTFDAPLLVPRRNGSLVAVWSAAWPDAASGEEGTPRGYVSQSDDGGATWTEPRLLTEESSSVEYVEAVELSDGRLLAAWIDGRARTGDESGPAKLYARVIGTRGPDTAVDERVCECCRPSLVALPAGGASLAYRGRSAGELRDILVARFAGEAWFPAQVLTPSGWRIEGCPVNGPRQSAAGGRVARAWYAGGGQTPRVLFSRSTADGTDFAPALTVDLGGATGHVEVVSLPDGRAVVAWLAEQADQGTGLYLRLVGPTGIVGATWRAAEIPGGSFGRTFPRLAWAGRPDGDALLLTYTRPGSHPAVETRLVALPPVVGLP